MNTFLKTLALLLAAALPMTVAATALDWSLPTPVDPAHLFASFVVVVTLLTVFADYRPQKTLAIATSAAAPRCVRATLRLAA
jgi:hypothetical protein